MKYSLALMLLFVASTLFSQKYSHVGESPYQLNLPSDYYFDGIKFTKENSTYKYNDYCNFEVSDGYPSSEKITKIDTVEFRNVTYSSSDKIKKIEYFDIDKYKASLIYTENQFGFTNYLFVVYEEKVYIIQMRASVSKKSEIEEQISILKTAKFKPEEKPDAIKDANFTFDESALKNMEIWEDFGYPQIYFKNKDSYASDLSVLEIKRHLTEEEKEKIIKTNSYNTLKNKELDTIVDADIAGMKGKQFIAKGKDYKQESKAVYKLILFAPDNSFYILLKYETKGDIDKNLKPIYKFAGSIKLKENALSIDKLIGTWKINSIEKAYENDVCTDGLIGKEIKFTNDKINISMCDDDKIVKKELKYDIKYNKLMIYDITDIGGSPSETEYTCTGLILTKDTARINFWDIGLVDLTRVE